MVYIKKVLLLFGGNSSEHYISCLSAKTIIENIDQTKYDLTVVGIDNNSHFYIFNDELSYLDKGTWKEAENIHLISNIINYIAQFDIVFPITHGNYGEDGKLQGFLDFFNFKYVGSKTLASAIGMNKSIAKMIFNYLNIPQVPHLTIEYPKYSIKKIIKEIGFPLIVKPANGGSSIGISKVNNKNELINAIEEASSYDNVIIIEKFIIARELECSVLENKKLVVSSIGEIVPISEFYDYSAKYESKESKLLIPAKLPKGVNNTIKKYAKLAFNNINGKGYARVDFFYDEVNNKIYLNEINTIPGFTNISMFSQLLTFDTISLSEIITILIENA